MASKWQSRAKITELQPQVSVWETLVAREGILKGRSQLHRVLQLTEYLPIPTQNRAWDGESLSGEGNRYAGESVCSRARDPRGWGFPCWKHGGNGIIDSVDLRLLSWRLSRPTRIVAPARASSVLWPLCSHCAPAIHPLTALTCSAGLLRCGPRTASGSPGSPPEVQNLRPSPRKGSLRLCRSASSPLVAM